MASNDHQANVSVQDMIAKQKGKKGKKRIEKSIPVILFIIASISVLTTFGIVFTLIFETFEFFQRVPFFDFLLGTEWLPFSNNEPLFGILPLIAGTLKVTLIAVVVAVPFGLASAVYLSEYASDNMRRVIKPVLEVLAGVPTIVTTIYSGVKDF